jgi:hypothetical protein
VELAVSIPVISTVKDLLQSGQISSMESLCELKCLLSGQGWKESRLHRICLEMRDVMMPAGSAVRTLAAASSEVTTRFD